jgi:hypothetical protein
MLGKAAALPGAAVPPTAVPSAVLTVQAAADDLSVHPGTAEGHRNDTLCRLVGAHLARGEDAETIATLASAWAERCSPPMPETEVARTVESLATKHQRTATTSFVRSQPQHNGNGNGDGEFEVIPLPAAPPWPTLGDAAYHGLAGEIIKTIEPETEADPVALLLSFFVCFGNIVGRKPHYLVEGDTHHGNLFAAVVGATGEGRKGTSLGRAMQTFDGIDGDWSNKCISTGLSSGEGLIWAVRDRIEGLEPVKEKGKIVGYQDVVRDAGVEDKRLLVVEPELAQALRVLSREGNTLSPTIRAAWDRGDLRTLTKNNQARATGAHISILGNITLPELKKYLHDTEMFNGFSNRFLWALVKRSKLLPDGGKQLNLHPLKQKLGEAYKVASRIEGMTRSPAARELWWSLYPALTAGTPGLAGAATGRGEAQTLRLSLLYALLDGSPIIDLPHLQAAHAVWCYCKASAHIIFANEQEDPLQSLLLAAIKAQPGINRKGLHKVTGGHIPAVTLMAALVGIRDQGRVRCEVASTGGRPAERWYPSERTNNGCGEASAVGDGLSSFARNQSVATSTNTGSGSALPNAHDAGNSQPSAGDAQRPNKPAFLAACSANGNEAQSELEPAAEPVPEPDDKAIITPEQFFALAKSPEGRAELAKWHAKRVSKGLTPAERSDPLSAEPSQQEAK